MTDSQTPKAGTAAKRPARTSHRGRRLLSIILVALVLLLAAASYFLLKLVLPQGQIASTPKDAGGLTWVSSIYGWGRAKSQQLVTPESVAVAPDGTIWTTNPGNGRVIGFNADSTFRTMLAGSNKTPFVSPTDVGTDPSGNVYVAENTMNRIVVLTPQGTELRVLKVQTPTAVTASADRIVVGSDGGFAILDKAGVPIKIIGTQGKGDGQFDRVNGLAIGPDGRIYVVDTYNNRISAYSPTGTRLWIVDTGNPANKTDIVAESTKPKPSATAAKMQLPLQAALDANGRLVVVDGFDFSLNLFDTKTGKFIAKYGAYGNVDGKMLYPQGVAYDAGRDWFVVADGGNDRLQIFRISDSAPGNVTSAVSRVLAGPIRACMFPLLLLVLALIVAAVVRLRRNRKATQVTEVTEPAKEA